MKCEGSWFGSVSATCTWLRTTPSLHPQHDIVQLSILLQVTFPLEQHKFMTSLRALGVAPEAKPSLQASCVQRTDILTASRCSCRRHIVASRSSCRRHIVRRTSGKTVKSFHVRSAPRPSLWQGGQEWSLAKPTSCSGMLNWSLLAALNCDGS